MHLKASLHLLERFIITPPGIPSLNNSVAPSMIKEFRDVENAPLNVHLIDKSNNGERLIADLFLHRTVSWKP